MEFNNHFIHGSQDTAAFGQFLYRTWRTKNICLCIKHSNMFDNVNSIKNYNHTNYYYII